MKVYCKDCKYRSPMLYCNIVYKESYVLKIRKSCVEVNTEGTCNLYEPKKRFFKGIKKGDGKLSIAETNDTGGLSVV